MGRHTIYLDDNLEKRLKMYARKNKFKSTSAATRDCLTKTLLSEEYDESSHNISQKLNRILYRQNITTKLIEQIFANMGFRINENVDKDELLKEFYDSINKYSGWFD